MPSTSSFSPFSGVLCAVDSGCDSVTDTETEDEKVLPYSKQQCLPLETSPGNLMVVQPDRIRCGVGTPGPGGVDVSRSMDFGAFQWMCSLWEREQGSPVAAQSNPSLTVGFPVDQLPWEPQCLGPEHTLHL